MTDTLDKFKDEWIDPALDVLDNPVGDFVTEVLFGAGDDNEKSEKSNEEMIKAIYAQQQKEALAASTPTADRIAMGTGRAESAPQVIKGRNESTVNNKSALDYVKSEASQFSPQLQKELKRFFMDNKYFVNPDQYASRYRRNRS
tara:strand:+ start:15 stop:446 length:432 start_codon:yes stop_codon:yes gene_type:complete